MEESILLNDKKVKLCLLPVIDEAGRESEEYIAAVNVTDIIFSPDVSAQLRDHIAHAYPDIKTVYYRIWTDEAGSEHFSAVMEDDGTGKKPGINVKPEELKHYEPTLEKLRPAVKA